MALLPTSIADNDPGHSTDHQIIHQYVNVPRIAYVTYDETNGWVRPDSPVVWFLKRDADPYPPTLGENAGGTTVQEMDRVIHVDKTLVAGGSNNITLTIVETSTGVWSSDVPARANGDNPVIFIGTTDPADPTNGVATPANINDSDRWIQV